MPRILGLVVVALFMWVGLARPSDFEIAQIQLPKLTQPFYDVNGRSRSQERLPYEVLGSCVSTVDGQDVPVYRCLGGNEQPLPNPSTEAFYLESTSSSRVITLRPRSGLLPDTDDSREYLRQPNLRAQMDPFLVVDAYHTNERTAYSRGFPAHPHKGMMEIRHFHQGGLHHEDGCGNIAVTPPGGAQMLFAGRGIAHEELPVGSMREAWELLETTRAATGLEATPSPKVPDTEGTCTPHDPHPFKWEGFHGFQMWVQLPSQHHSARPQFRSVAALPTVHLTSVLHTTFIDRVQRVEYGRGAHPSLVGGTSPTVWSEWSPPAGQSCPWSPSPKLPSGESDAVVRVLAGRFHNVTGPFTDFAKDDNFMYLDIEIKGRKICESGNNDDAHKFVTIDVPSKQNVLLYVYDIVGDTSCSLKPMLRVGKVKEDAVVVRPRSLVVLSEGSHVVLNSLCMGACEMGRCTACPSIRVLLMTASPVRERAFVHQGFVGSSTDALKEAVREFKAGRAIRNMWKGITLSATGITATAQDVKSTGEQISSALSSGTCPIELASTLHAFLALGMIRVVEGRTTPSHTIDMLVETIQASYPQQGAKEPLWRFYTELTKMQLIQSQASVPADVPMTAPLDLLTEELEMETPDVSLPLSSSALEPTSTAIGKAIWGDSPVGTTWSQRLTAHFRPRRVVRMYKSYSVGLDITRHDSSLVTTFSSVLDGFSDASIQQLRSEVCGDHHVHPVTFFWAGLVACLTAPTLSYPKGAPRDLLELYDAVYGGDSRAPGLVTSLLTALSMVLYSLLGTSLEDLLALEGAVVTVRPFSPSVPTDQLDTATAPSNPALCRMVIKLVESLFNNRLLFANPETGFVPMLSPSMSYAVFVDFHCRLDEVVIANREYRSTKKEVVCRDYSIDPSVLIKALNTPASAFNSVTADHTGMAVEVVAEMTRQTALYAKETKVESCVPGSQNTPASTTNFDIPPPLPSGERFFKLTHPVPEPSWGDYFNDRFQCTDSTGRTISTCGLFIKTAPLLFVSELLYRGMWDWVARLVQSSMEGGGLYNSPLNLFLYPHRSLSQLSTVHLALQLNAQSSPALRNETIHHSYVTAMVSNMHLDAASSQQIDWAPSSFVYSLQAQLVNMFERDVSNPIVKGLVKPLQQGTVPDAHTRVAQVLSASLSTLLRMIPLLRVCQSYFSAYHFPVISRVMSFLATMVRVEGIRNREAFGAGVAPDWKWCTAASEAYVAFVAPSIRCTCAVSPSVALFDVLEELLDALSYPVFPLDVSTGRLSVSASQVRLHARLLVAALELPKVTMSAEKWASFPLPRFVDSDLLCAPYDTSSTDGPGRRYPHDAVQTKEIAAIMNQSMRRVTSDNVHQYTLTLRKVLFSDPILFIRKLISLAIGNADSDLIFCQAQLLQGAPKAILRMFVVLAIDAMETHAEQERSGAEQRVGLIGALIAFVWAQNSNNFQECGRLLLRTVADILQREAKSSATFAVELLRSLLLHMLHEPLESEEQYNSQQLVALAALPISRWFAQNGADSFLQNKWFDPQTMLLKMKGAKKDSVAQADEAMAFSYMSSVNSSKSNLDASTESQFSYRNFIFAASFTPLTLDQCRLGFCEALGAALDPCVCDVSVGAVIIQRLSAWHARTYDWYSDLSGTVEDVMKVSARHTSCFLDLTLSLVQLSCIGKHAGAIIQLPIVQLDMLKNGLPQVAARCRLVLQEFGAVETIPSNSINDMFWQLSSPDASYPKSAYYYALQQVHRFLRQAITGHAGPAPTSKNEDKGLSIEEVATIEEGALRDYLKEMADEEAKRRRQHFKDQLSARATEDKIEVEADNSDDEEASDSGAGTIKGMIMGATWLRIEQKVIARYLLDAKDAVVREAIAHSSKGTAPLTDLADRVAKEVLGDASLDRIIAFSHDALVPRVLLSSADGVVVGLLFRQLWEGLKKSVNGSASTTVTRLQQERAASRLMELLNTFVTELIVFLPSLTDAEAKRAGLALQRVLTLSKEVAAVATPAPATARTGVMASILGKGTQTTAVNGLPLPMEAFLAQSFSQLLQECDMSNLTPNAAQGSGYSLIVRNAFIILERIKLTLVEGSTAKPEALFPTAQPYVTTLSDSVRLHATKTSASYAAASSLAALYDSRVKSGDKRPRSGEAVDSWVE